MREILFRGKRQDNSEWVEGVPIKNHIGTFICFDENPHYCHQYGYMEIDKIIQVVPETVCQLAGLTDKNGVKIWENDILRMFYEDGETDIGTIRYTDECVRFQYYEANLIGYGIDITCHMEVIGNIFDNPELVEGGVADE